MRNHFMNLIGIECSSVGQGNYLNPHKESSSTHRKEPSHTQTGLGPEWQTIRWLQQCKLEIMDDKVIWWALTDPLTDGSDATSQALAKRLVAAWMWTFTHSEYCICPPALTSLNIGQFLPQGSTGTVQEWLLAYACALQHVGEAAHGKSWHSNGDNYTLQVSL